jgi:uncharacterized integral membrane protein
MKKQWSMVGAIILFLGVAILSVLNVDPVPVNFGFAVVEWPLIVIIFVSVLLGALIATLLSTYKAFKDQRKNKHKNSTDKTDASEGPGLRTTRSDKSAKDKPNNDEPDSKSKSQDDDLV